MPDIALITFAIALALVFDFLNGFHDAANSIATIVGTRVLKPLYAVAIAATANFAGPFVFGTAVATTVGKGIIAPEFSVVHVIAAGLIGAIVWDAVTWYWGLPTSSSHALIGGLIGPAMFAGGVSAVVFEGISKVITFMVVSPFIGFAIAFLLTISVMRLFRRSAPGFVNKIFGRLQILSSSFFSLAHGANDGQKTMGVITALLVAGSFIDHFYVPVYVIMMAAFAISMGTFFGGWRIVKTMGLRITHLRPYHGFCAETGGGVILTAMAYAGIPVSTTQAISGAIMGAGSTSRLSAVRWGIGRKIVWSWLITIPATALIGVGAYMALGAAGIA